MNKDTILGLLYLAYTFSTMAFFTIVLIDTFMPCGWTLWVTLFAIILVFAEIFAFCITPWLLLAEIIADFFLGYFTIPYLAPSVDIHWTTQTMQWIWVAFHLLIQILLLIYIANQPPKEEVPSDENNDESAEEYEVRREDEDYESADENDDIDLDYYRSLFDEMLDDPDYRDQLIALADEYADDQDDDTPINNTNAYSDTDSDNSSSRKSSSSWGSSSSSRSRSDDYRKGRDEGWRDRYIYGDSYKFDSGHIGGSSSHRDGYYDGYLEGEEED